MYTLIIQYSISGEDMCPPEFERVGSYCYKLNTEEMDQLNQVLFCQRSYGYLAAISTSEENSEVLNFIAG